MRITRLSLPLLTGLVLGGCVDNSGNTNVECRALEDSPTKVAARTAGSPFSGTVFTIVMENKSQGEILDGSEAPYIKSLAASGAVARGYTDAFVHPSEPNYIWMVAGENFGILDDDAPAGNHIASTSHIVDQMEMAGIDWGAYMEGMGEPCGVESNYPYEPKHNPFVYFDDINGWDGKTFTKPARCMEHVVDYAELDTDLAADALPRYVFITPNMENDMHDGSIADGDVWLSRELPKILASTAFKEGGVVFLTWDEGATRSTSNWSADDDPPMIVISPLAKAGYVSEEPYDTSSYLKTVQAILGLDPLPCDAAPADVSTMDDLFSAELPRSG